MTLLPPDAHAEALQAMQRHGRIPMSFTHGDVDVDHLEQIVLDDDGRRRFDSVSFAVHVDSTMRGRRGVKHPRSEAELDDERARIAGMFDELHRRHGVRSYLAHSMTVTPDTLDEVAHVVRVCRGLGFRMNAFQPAAHVGDHRRWHGGHGDLTDDVVWGEVERGVGRSLPFGLLQVGDGRCNRTTWGVWAGDRYVPILEDGDGRDEAARDAWLRTMPANLRLDPWPVKLARMGRALAARPGDASTLVRWMGRLATRGAPGLWRPTRSGSRVQATTYVMHRFMDADDVATAWDGSGSSRKTRVLLEAMHRTGSGQRYAPVEISEAALVGAAEALIADHPWLEVHGHLGDFGGDLARLPRCGRRLLAFLGSTIGNPLPAHRQGLFGAVADALGPGDAFLFGADLVKSPDVLIPAYDDAAGVTAAFNRNMLAVLNRELDGDLPVDAFAHRAVWNADEERIEMHLVADQPVLARLAAVDLDVTFRSGEPLVTEYSCKFRIEDLADELRAAGLDVQEVWTDPDDWFAVLLATAGHRSRWSR